MALKDLFKGLMKQNEQAKGSVIQGSDQNKSGIFPELNPVQSESLGNQSSGSVHPMLGGNHAPQPYSPQAPTGGIDSSHPLAQPAKENTPSNPEATGLPASLLQYESTFSRSTDAPQLNQAPLEFISTVQPAATPSAPFNMNAPMQPQPPAPFDPFAAQDPNAAWAVMGSPEAPQAEPTQQAFSPEFNQPATNNDPWAALTGTSEPQNQEIATPQTLEAFSPEAGTDMFQMQASPAFPQAEYTQPAQEYPQLQPEAPQANWNSAAESLLSQFQHDPASPSFETLSEATQESTFQAIENDQPTTEFINESDLLSQFKGLDALNHLEPVSFEASSNEEATENTTPGFHAEENYDLNQASDLLAQFTSHQPQAGGTDLLSAFTSEPPENDFAPQAEALTDPFMQNLASSEAPTLNTMPPDYLTPEAHAPEEATMDLLSQFNAEACAYSPESDPMANPDLLLSASFETPADPFTAPDLMADPFANPDLLTTPQNGFEPEFAPEAQIQEHDTPETTEQPPTIDFSAEIQATYEAPTPTETLPLETAPMNLAEASDLLASLRQADPAAVQPEAAFNLAADPFEAPAVEAISEPQAWESPAPEPAFNLSEAEAPQGLIDPIPAETQDFIQDPPAQNSINEVELENTTVEEALRIDSPAAEEAPVMEAAIEVNTEAMAPTETPVQYEEPAPEADSMPEGTPFATDLTEPALSASPEAQIEEAVIEKTEIEAPTAAQPLEALTPEPAAEPYQAAFAEATPTEAPIEASHEPEISSFMDFVSQPIQDEDPASEHREKILTQASMETLESLALMSIETQQPVASLNLSDELAPVPKPATMTEPEPTEMKPEEIAPAEMASPEMTLEVMTEEPTPEAPMMNEEAAPEEMSIVHEATVHEATIVEPSSFPAESITFQATAQQPQQKISVSDSMQALKYATILEESRFVQRSIDHLVNQYFAKS